MDEDKLYLHVQTRVLLYAFTSEVSCLVVCHSSDSRRNFGCVSEIIKASVPWKGTHGKVHPLKHPKALERVDAISARVFRSPTAGDALPFYVRCPSISSSEIALARLIPWQPLVINLPVRLLTEDWSFLRTDGGKELRCHGTRVLVGQFFSWNSGCIHTSVMSRTPRKKSKRFCYSADRTVYFVVVTWRSTLTVRSLLPFPGLWWKVRWI